jgi:hypothetical protein
MVPEQADSSNYRDRAAIYGELATQAGSAETAAALLYLEQMWLVVAKVAEVTERNRPRSSFGSAPHHLPLQ